MIHSNNWPNWWNTINTKIRFHKTSSARMRILFCAWDFFVIMYSSKQYLKEGFMTKFSPWLYCHFCKYLSSELYFLDLQSLVEGCFLDFSLSSLTTCLAFAAKLLFSPGCSFWLLSQLFLDLATRSCLIASGNFICVQKTDSQTFKHKQWNNILFNQCKTYFLINRTFTCMSSEMFSRKKSIATPDHCLRTE